MSDAARSRGAGWPAALAVGALLAAAWLATPDLTWPARLLTVFLVAVLPALMLAQGAALRGLDPAELPRTSVYLSSSLALWVLAAITAVAAWASGFTRETLGLFSPSLLPLVGWTAGVILFALGITVAARAMHVRETPLLEHLLPRTRAERAWWVGVSVTAGVCEEIVFRAFLIPALVTVTGAIWMAALVSSFVFGFLHGYQGVAGIVRTTLMGLALAVPFLLTGSILPSILAHFALDVILGIWMADWLLRR
jgi:uncharacterized protein